MNGVFYSFPFAKGAPGRRQAWNSLTDVSNTARRAVSIHAAAFQQARAAGTARLSRQFIPQQHAQDRKRAQRDARNAPGIVVGEIHCRFGPSLGCFLYQAPFLR